MSPHAGSGAVDPHGIRNARAQMRSWLPGQDRWTRSEPTINDVLGMDLFSSEGAVVIQLPEIAKVENLQKKNDPLRAALSDKFKIPLFFWSRTAWDANGFFGAHYDPLPAQSDSSVVQSYSLMTRFLIKSVLEQGPLRGNTGTIVRHNSLAYTWDFIGFYALWLELQPGPNGGRRTKQILLCFDLNKDVWNGVRDNLDAYDPRILDSSPYGGLVVTLQSLVMEYDKKLWSFRVPIRDIEKNRLFIKSDDEMRAEANKLPAKKTKNGQDEAQPLPATKSNSKLNGVKGKSRNEDLDRDDRMTRYENIHELQRHIIHSSETLRVAATTLEAMYEDTQGCDFALKEPVEQLKRFKNTQKSIKFCLTFLKNLEKRAQAFDDRLKNEINLDFNSVAAELQNQNANLTTTVSVITLLFLPGSFVATFFGSNFFNTSFIDGSTEARFIYTKEIWIFFVVTVPITLVALGIWIHQTNRHLPRWIGHNLSKFKKRARPKKSSDENIVPKGKIRPWPWKALGGSSHSSSDAQA